MKMITPSAAAHKVSRAKTLVTVWSPWWHVYLTKCDFTYVYDDSLSIMGSSSLVMTVGLEFVQSHNLMDIAIALEFALQQSLRSMDTRAQRYIKDHPRVRHDVIGLAQSLEINDDINLKFSSVPESKWHSIVTKMIDDSYLASYDAVDPPSLPEGWLTPQDFGFEPGLTAEKYIRLIIEKNEHDEEEFFNPDDDPQEETGDKSSSDQPEEDNQDGGDGSSDKKESSEEGSTPDSEGGQSEDGESSVEGDTDGGDHSPQPPLGLAQGTDGGSSSSNEESSGAHTAPSKESSEKPQEPSDAQSRTSTQVESHSASEGSTGVELDASGGHDDNRSDESPLHQPASPFRDDYSGDVEAINPQPAKNVTGAPPPVNKNPNEVQDSRAETPADDRKTHQAPEGIDSDVASVEQNIASDFESTRDHDQSGSGESPHEDSLQGSQGEEKRESAQEETDNPWGEGNQRPSGETAPQPDTSSPSPAQGEQADMAALEATLADQQDDSPTGTQEDLEEMRDKYQHLLDRMKNQTGDSGLHNFDIPQHRQDTSAVGLSAEERSELDAELAESIKEYQDSIPTEGGFTPGDNFIAWSNEKLRKPMVPWQKVLRKLVTLSVSRAQMAGQSDLSYAKANPNQQPDMPIMMGFITYPPEVTVLMDTSPSMLREKHKALSEFAGVIQKILIQYSQPVVMAAADNSIKYVAYSTSPSQMVVKNMGKTHDGSSAKFGDTVARVAKKGVKFRGRNYPAPDVLIIFTDCLFEWPLPENARLPMSYATVIVASTSPYEEIEKYLPNWVKEKKNFVYIPD